MFGILHKTFLSQNLSVITGGGVAVTAREPREIQLLPEREANGRKKGPREDTRGGETAESFSDLLFSQANQQERLSGALMVAEGAGWCSEHQEKHTATVCNKSCTEDSIPGGTCIRVPAVQQVVL